MTRQEQIKLAAQEHREAFFDNKSREGRVAKASFIAGAEWADAHPHWISVDDEMPKDGECVATINTVGVKDVRHYSHGKWYSNFGNEYDDITHWMRLPAEPKKGGAQ